MRKYVSLPIALLAFVLAFFSCQKEDNIIKEPVITENSIGLYATHVTFNWTVDYPGKIASVVEISLNADMTNSQRFGSESYTDDKTFTAMATGLNKETTYYYRYLVWNPNSSFECDTKSFSTITGYIDALFSVSSSAKVYFSQGDLQYQASTNTWRFAEQQYDVIGSDNSNISSSYSGWIDLFGWGTSGWNSGAVCYQPWSISTLPSDYKPGGSYTNNITGDYANADWGVYNAISNGGNKAGLWRSLTWDEWLYVLYNRSTASGIRFAKACVNGVNGVILLPDDWNGGYYSFNNPNMEIEASFGSNNMSASQWDTLEQHGAVFLPAAGIRHGTLSNSVSVFCEIWSSTSCYDEPCGDFGAKAIFFRDNDSDPNGWYDRSYGLSVRLVRSAQ